MTVDETRNERLAEEDGRARLETRVDCRLKIDNEEVGYNVSSLVLEQSIDNHHVLKVSVRQGGRATYEDEFLPADKFTGFLGKSIAVNVEPQGGVMDSSLILEFIGTVTQVSLDNAIDEVNQVTITAHSPCIAMDGGPRNALNLEMTSSDIISSILGQYQITLGEVTSSSRSHALSVQYRETDYAYVRRLAAGAGLFSFYDGKKFQVVKASSGTSQKLEWRQSLGLFTIGLGTASPNQATQVWDYMGKQVLDGEFTGSPGGASPSDLVRMSLEASETMYPKLGFVSASKATDMSGVDATLKRAKEAAVGGMVVCRGESIVPALGVGQCARVSGMGSIDGTYWVQAVKHVMDESGQYHNSFTCTPLDVAYPPPVAPRSDVTALQSALVKDNNDPDALGRVTVIFPWAEDTETPWLRVVSPHAGAERGWYSIPEIDDEVLVGFEHGDPDLPVVLGSVYNQQDKPPEEGPDSDNNVKIFMTKSGNQITLIDTDGSEEIRIAQKDGTNTIVLELGGPSISLESEGDISIKGANVAIESTSGDISIKAAGGLTQESGADTEIKAGMNLKAEGGMNCDVKGGINTNVEGGVMTVIKGGIVQIN